MEKEDVNEKSFQLQKILFEKREKVNEIRRQIEAIRSLGYVIQHKISATYFPWETKKDMKILLVGYQKINK